MANKNYELKINCIYEKEDYITFDPSMEALGIDLYNFDDGEKTNLGVVLNKEQTEELIAYLQGQLKNLK